MTIQLTVYEDDFFKDDKNAYIAEIRGMETAGAWADVSYHCDEVPSISDGQHVIYFGLWADGTPLIWAIQDENNTLEQVDLGSFDTLTSAVLFCDNRRKSL